MTLVQLNSFETDNFGSNYYKIIGKLPEALSLALFKGNCRLIELQSVIEHIKKKTNYSNNVI